MVTGFTNVNQEDPAKTLTVSYTENGITKTDTYVISITDSVKSIKSVTFPHKEYKYKDELNLTGAQMVVEKGSGDETVNITAGMIPDFDNTDTDTNPRNITINYGGQTATVTGITVKDYVDRIDLSTTELTGTMGEALQDIIDRLNVTYTVHYAKKGNQTAKKLDASTMVTGYNDMLAIQTLTARYRDNDTNSFTEGDDINKDFKVTLSNEIVGVKITPPAKNEYNWGETPNSATVLLTYADTTTAPGDLSKLKLYEQDETTLLNMRPSASEFDSTTQKLTKPVKYIYTEGGKKYKEDWNITIVNGLEGITTVGIPGTDYKVKYNANENLDLAGLKISIARQAGGTPEVINVTDSMVSGFVKGKLGEQTVTITYTENGVTETATYKVNVEDSIISIDSVVFPKKNYKYNEELDLVGASITVTKGSGPDTIAITSNMVSGYDKTDISRNPQTLTITYDGKTIQVPGITVKDYVDSITITPPSVTGATGKTIVQLISDNNITYTVNYAKAGAVAKGPLTADMVQGYNSNNEGTQNYTVIYEDNDPNSYTNGSDIPGSLEVTLSKQVAKATITVPTKDRYKHGESLDLSDGKIELTYSDGTTASVPLPITPDMVKEVGGGAVNMSPTNYGSTQKVDKVLKIKYTSPEGKDFEIDYPITIVNEVTGITMKDYPKQDYQVGEPESLAGGTITVTRMYGASETVQLTDPRVTVTGFDSSLAGVTKTINVAFKENNVTKNTQYQVNIEDQVQSIAWVTKPKTSYKYGESLSVAGGVISVTKSSGTSNVNLTASMVTELDGSPFDSTNTTPRKLKVTYMGKELTYDITVEDTITGIEVKGPSKSTYAIGESLDLTGATVTVVYASGKKDTPVPITPDMITNLSSFDETKEGTYTLNILHEGKQGNFTVRVQDELNDVRLVTYPTTVEYEYGEPLDLTGGQIELIKASGDSVFKDITPDMVSGYKPTEVGKQILTISYNGTYLGEYEIEVKDAVSKLNVIPNKTTFKYGEELDLTGGVVQVVMKSGAIDETVDLTEDMISGYDKEQLGEQIIYVEYKGLKGTFDIIVMDEIINIELVSEPDKIRYAYGEELDLTGAMLKITMLSGEMDLPVAENMISGYNAEEPGAQVITVKFEGYEFKFIVIVEERPKEEPPEPTPVPTPVPTPTPTQKPTNKLPIVEWPERPVIEETEPTPTPVPTEKPTPTPTPVQDRPQETLGVKDKKQDNGLIVAYISLLTGSILLAILFALRRNTKIYVEENGEFELGGSKRLSRRKMYIDLDEFLEEATYLNKVKIVLNKKIAKKLDGELIEVTHRGVTKRFRVDYSKDEFEIILE
ncbi:MAG: hypothetical protein HFJ50_01660 [Clostridia bacterium]|jgi:hypothetical protein|nr:hypothetical protein [Clostridia bacterium]